MTSGFINLFHIESMGALDGPGIRTVFFLKGCPLRCHYCHNPESWDGKPEQLMSFDAVLNIARRMKPYYKNGGGVTFSGGEPLMQAKALLPLVKALIQENIHVALDTSGCMTTADSFELIKLVDLVILDIKHTTADGFFQLTGGQLQTTIHFLEWLINLKKPYWIRQVVVPGFNDKKSFLQELEKMSRSEYREKIELLGFHKDGMYKWKQRSPFAEYESMLPKQLVILQEYVNKLFETA